MKRKRKLHSHNHLTLPNKKLFKNLPKKKPYQKLIPQPKKKTLPETNSPTVINNLIYVIGHHGL